MKSPEYDYEWERRAMSSGRMPVRDGELFFDDTGAGHPLVLLHEATLDHRMWDAQVDVFVRAGYRVIRYDARGHGNSSTPAAEFSACDDLADLLTGLDISRASLVGLSFGARTAVDFAITHPDAVEMLVLANPRVSGMKIEDPATVEALQHQAAAAQTRDADGYVEQFIRAWVDGPNRTPDQIDENVRRRCALMAMDVLKQHSSASGAIREVDAIDRLDELAAPLLVLVGDLDSSDIHAVAGRIEEQARFAASAVIPGSGHLMSMEQPAAFNAAVVTFLERAQLVR